MPVSCANLSCSWKLDVVPSTSAAPSLLPSADEGEGGAGGFVVGGRGAGGVGRWGIVVSV